MSSQLGSSRPDFDGAPYGGLDLATLLQDLPAVVFVAEAGVDGHWLYVSPQIENILGLTAEAWYAHPGPLEALARPERRAARLRVRIADPRGTRHSPLRDRLPGDEAERRAPLGAGAGEPDRAPGRWARAPGPVDRRHRDAHRREPARPDEPSPSRAVRRVAARSHDAGTARVGSSPGTRRPRGSSGGRRQRRSGGSCRRCSRTPRRTCSGSSSKGFSGEAGQSSRSSVSARTGRWSTSRSRRPRSATTAAR